MRRHGAYELSDDPGRVDPAAVWDFLSTSAYWGRWRGFDDVRRQVEGAWRVVGAYADVYVLEPHRGHGVGTALVDEMAERGPGRDFRWMPRLSRPCLG